jgi:hypothetical protein
MSRDVEQREQGFVMIATSWIEMADDMEVYQ